MKKIFTLLTGFAFLVLPSCSDGETASLVVNNDEDEISINRLGGIIEVPVSAEGSWKVAVEGSADADGIVWCGVDEPDGSGKGKIAIDVDYFSPMAQKQERTANIIIENGSQKKVVRLRQFIGMKDGEAVDNATTEPFADLWNSKGIGSGYDVLTGKQTGNVVFNTKGLIQLASSGDPEYASLFRQTTNPDAKNKVMFTDTLERNNSHINAECNIDVKYASFKLNLHVVYDNKGEQINNKKTYNASQSVVFLSSSTDALSISGFLEDDPDFEETTTKQLVSRGFRNLYRSISRAHKSGDETDLNDNIQRLLDSYGPVVVTGADLGGSLFVSMNCDSILMENNFNVTGKLTADVLLAGISISGDVSVTVGRNGKDIWRHGEHYVSASGGDKAALNALVEAISVAEPDDRLLREASSKWIDSIVSSNNSDDNTTVVSISYTPIWTLFPSAIARKIKAYAVERYKDEKICTFDLKDLGME